MATLYITEFPALGTTHLGTAAQVPMMPPVADTTIAIGAATNSATFQTNTALVRLHADTGVSVVFTVPGSVATTSKMRLAANQTEYFMVPMNASYHLSAILNG